MSGISASVPTYSGYSVRDKQSKPDQAQSQQPSIPVGVSQDEVKWAFELEQKVKSGYKPSEQETEIYNNLVEKFKNGSQASAPATTQTEGNEVRSHQTSKDEPVLVRFGNSVKETGSKIVDNVKNDSNTHLALGGAAVGAVVGGLPGAAVGAVVGFSLGKIFDFFKSNEKTDGESKENSAKKTTVATTVGGTAIGFAVAGPIGAVVGGALGWFFGKKAGD